MPLIQVFTSAAPDAGASDKLLRELSGALAAHFEKPEQWVMTCIVPGLAMTFGGSSGPTCFAAVKNIDAVAAAGRVGQTLRRVLVAIGRRILRPA